jgi:hypothetical protein
LNLFFPAFPLTQWRIEKTDISDHSGGTVTEFHRVPFARIHTFCSGIILVSYNPVKKDFQHRQQPAQIQSSPVQANLQLDPLLRFIHSHNFLCHHAKMAQMPDI